MIHRLRLARARAHARRCASLGVFRWLVFAFSLAAFAFYLRGRDVSSFLPFLPARRFISSESYVQISASGRSRKSRYGSLNPADAT